MFILHGFFIDKVLCLYHTILTNNDYNSYNKIIIRHPQQNNFGFYRVLSRGTHRRPGWVQFKYVCCTLLILLGKLHYRTDGRSSAPRRSDGGANPKIFFALFPFVIFFFFLFSSRKCFCIALISSGISSGVIFSHHCTPRTCLRRTCTNGSGVYA